jgi:hypothetical protein
VQEESKGRELPERDPKFFDRSQQYTDATPERLRDQLNENWRQLRLMKTTVADRDIVIANQQASIAARDLTIKLQNDRNHYTKLKIALRYSVIGGVAAKLAEVAALAAFHYLATHMRVN